MRRSFGPSKALLVVLLVTGLVLLTGLALAQTQISGETDVDVSVPNTNVESGEDTDLEVFVTNDGEVTSTGTHPPEARERVTEARSTEVEITDADDAPIRVRSNEQQLGTIQSGEAGGPATFDIVVADDAEPGEYDIDVRVRYSQTSTARWERDDDGNVDIEDVATSSRIETFTVEITIEDEPKFELVDADHDVQVDELGFLTAEFNNTGTEGVNDTVLTASASDQDIFFGDGGPETEVYIGDWAPGETKEIALRPGTNAEALPRPYPIDLTLEYTDSDGQAATDTETTVIEPLPRQRYTVESVSHDAIVGDDGVLELELRNEGPRNVTESSVTVAANDPDVVFGGGAAEEAVDAGEFAFEVDEGGAPTSEAYVGNWTAGETKTLLYRVGADGDAIERNYTIDATVSARDEADNPLNDRDRQFGLQPGSEQTFVIENTENSLYVGEDGDVHGTVTNTANRTAENVVVLYDSEEPNVNPRETQYAIGTLEPGESAPFHFRVGLSEEAEAGPRVLEFQTRYRNHDGDVRLDDAQDLFVEVGPERDAFAIRAVDAAFDPGDSGTVAMEVENTRGERLEDIRVKLFTASPLSSDDDEAFIQSLEPGENETVVFDLSVGSNAIPKDYPVSVDVRYDDERNDTQLSGTYRVPITVTDPGFQLPTLPLLVLLLALGAGVWYYRRERPEAFEARMRPIRERFARLRERLRGTRGRH